MTFAWRGASWFSHLAFLGVMALLNAALSDAPTRNGTAIDSKASAEQALEANFTVDMAPDERKNYLSMAIFVSRHTDIPGDGSKKLVAQIVETLKCNAHSQLSRHDLQLAGFLAFVHHRLVTQSPPDNQPIDEDTRGSLIDVDQVTLEDLHRDAFHVRLDSHVDLILGFWKYVSEVRDVGPTALVTQYIWREIRSLVNATQIQNPSWLQDIAKHLRFETYLNAAEWYQTHRVGNAPLKFIGHLRLLDNWLYHILRVDCSTGIFYECLDDQKTGCESWKFGFAILLLLHETCARQMVPSELQSAVRYHVHYFFEIVQTIPEAFGLQEEHSRKALEQLGRYSTISEADMCSLGLVLALAAGEAYNASLILMNYQRLGAVAHRFVCEKLQGPQYDLPGIGRFDAFLHTFEKIFFHDGYPKSLDAAHKSQARWVATIDRAQSALNYRRANQRTESLTSAARRLATGNYNLRAFLRLEPTDGIGSMCKTLIQHVRDREQSLPDVLHIHDKVSPEDLGRLIHGTFEGPVHSLFADAMTTFGETGYWSPALDHCLNGRCCFCSQERGSAIIDREAR